VRAKKAQTGVRSPGLLRPGPVMGNRTFACIPAGKCSILKVQQQDDSDFRVEVTLCQSPCNLLSVLLSPAICGGAAVFGYYQTPSKLTLLQSRPTVTESRYTQGIDNQYRSWQARQNRIINRQCVSTC